MSPRASRTTLETGSLCRPPRGVGKFLSTRIAPRYLPGSGYLAVRQQPEPVLDAAGQFGIGQKNSVIASADPRFLVRRAPDGLRIQIGLGNRLNAGTIVCTDEPTWRADSGRISFSKLHPRTVLIV
jgi:hypothetical protein